MEQKKYNNYNKPSYEKKAEKFEAEISNKSLDNVDEKVENISPVVDEVNEKVEMLTVNEKMMKVTGCKKLNVRKEPSRQAPVLMIISENMEVSVIDSADPEWYKVTVTPDITGYVIKEFIKGV